ncbi:hypothetical protein M422DRAFT_158628 [Sphaerobolus stellatus SS14]|nr:hypothetical protein M422DRAFT_158628 [Sphaerobolus stellatus SS14]
MPDHEISVSVSDEFSDWSATAARLTASVPPSPDVSAPPSPGPNISLGGDGHEPSESDAQRDVVHGVSSLSGRGSGGVKRHKTYYFDNDQVIFLAEDTLFNVHKSILSRHSPVFRDMFEMPPTVDVEGSFDSNPIRLENVKALDFERLLSILYPTTVGKHTATLPEWISILQLATTWLFDDIRTLAISSLSKFDIEPVQKVAIALQCDVPEWLHSSYMALCDRAAPLTLEEARRLGVDVVAQLAYAREVYRDNRYRFKRGDVDLSSIVSEVFGTTPPVDIPPALVLKPFPAGWNIQSVEGVLR